MENPVTIHIFLCGLGTMIIGSILFIKAGHSISRIISNSLLMLILSFIPMFLTLVIWGKTGLPTILLPYAFPLSIFCFFYVFAKFINNHQNNDLSNDTREQVINTSLSHDEAQSIIQDYASFIENHSPTPGCVADINKLPYKKEIIKKALIIALKENTDEKMRGVLKSSYILLADWQENVGDINQGMDITNLDLSVDPKILAQNILANKAASDKWPPIVQAEQQSLSTELASMGF